MRLNLGCGGQIAADWVNIERQIDTAARAAAPPDAIIVERDLRDPFPCDDGSVECAVAHHTLDMLRTHELGKLLAEVHRVLEPGGTLRISTPDFAVALRAYYDGDSEWFTALGVPPMAMSDILDWYLDWGGTRRTPFFSAAHVGEYLTCAGFVSYPVVFERTTHHALSITELDSRPGESLFVEGRKL